MSLESLGMGLLPIVMGGLSGLSKFLKNIWNTLTTQPAKSIAALEAINRQSSVEDINKITAVFESYKEKVQGESRKIEQAVYEEVEYFMEELNQLLQENGEIMGKYRIRTNGIQRRISKIMSRLQGSIDHEVSRTVALDNPECKRILMMVPGERKERAMTAFFQEALKKALEKICEDIRDMLEEIFEELEEELPGAVDQSQREAELWKDELGKISADNDQQDKTRVIGEAENILAGCKVIEELMGAE